MKNVFSRWVQQTFTVGDRALELKVKALSPLEVPAFMEQMNRFGKMSREADEQGKLDTMFGLLYPDFARSCFEKYVRPVEAIETEEGPADTGAKVFDFIANHALVMDILLKIQALTITGAKEGKVSASPSTSSSVATGASGSDAISTVPEGGAQPSIATETSAAVA